MGMRRLLIGGVASMAALVAAYYATDWWLEKQFYSGRGWRGLR